MKWCGCSMRFGLNIAIRTWHGIGINSVRADNSHITCPRFCGTHAEGKSKSTTTANGDLSDALPLNSKYGRLNSHYAPRR